ncbi:MULTISPECIES: IMS domain-containing protein [unclassified Synechocystis]|uniref:IMS domain-containing protein n=1 Tax=unclassified Synechocystis TaxID=2640012 RepID=UPI0004074B7D|nr:MULTISPECIES: IMS domain-containing protein [unclassified Synechocystis]AIE75001.1 Cell division protein Ftn2, contains DnaJ domain [Synechocystis sp. PCC 6714]MCT0253292.1 DUF4101 domain-containing protein [Synechocystis sp. CS-94]
MFIPLDFYRILGIPPQSGEETIEQAHQDRLLQLPRREFSDAAVNVRNQLLAIAYETLRDPEKRLAYDREWWGVEDMALGEALPLATPQLECSPEQKIGALLILLDLGEYELVLKYGEPTLHEPVPPGGGTAQDYLLSVILAHWELSRERWQQQQYEFAATASLKALARLQQDNSFPELEEEIRQELYRLRPYRILELLARQGQGEAQRQQGLALLQAMIEDRGGIEGKGEDYSGLGNDDFLKFIHQLRCYLTVAEQNALFLPESQRPSLVASYLVVHSLMAEGVKEQQPIAIVEAKSLIAQLENCQDLALEKAICELLLGQTETVLAAIDQGEPKIATSLESKLAAGEDPLTAFYTFTEQWLEEEITPYFSDLSPAVLSLKAYFNNPSVQEYLEQLEPDSLTTDHSFAPDTLPSTATESQTPMVHSSAAFPDRPLAPTAPPRRSRSSRRSRETISSDSDNSPGFSTTTLAPAIAYDSDSLSSNGMGGERPSNGFTVNSSLGSAVPEHKPQRRRKKRVTIKPVRFGIFLLCLAAIVGGTAALVISRTGSPLATLAEDPLDVSLNQASEFIPDDATGRTLILSQPIFSQQVGQLVVQNWLDGKKLAFGPDHDFAALDGVLAPNLLAQQRVRAQQDKAQQRYRQYEHKLEILSYQVDPKNPNQATVTARVEEISQPFSLSNQQANGSATRDDLTVRYQLVRHQGIWKITQIQVVTNHS